MDWFRHTVTAELKKMNSEEARKRDKNAWSPVEGITEKKTAPPVTEQAPE
jgi:hypothetical protein